VIRLRVLSLIAVIVLAIAPRPTFASQCLAFVRNGHDVVPASFHAVTDEREVTITFVGHSTFRIRTPDGVVIATDYAGNAGPGPAPDIVTMNHAHRTHYTPTPDPRIDHVLRGWNPDGGPAKHDLAVGDVRIRNVPTDIRGPAGTVEKHGNSIFVFEVADLCIGHLGHLHHKLTRADRALLGRLDVVFVPVDGSYTLRLPAMIDVVTNLRASLVIPMHVFGGASLRRFIGGVRDSFEIRAAAESPMRVSLEGLPQAPTVLVPKALARQR
jgi:L-ascorbate metabolism protein UlaG (beta-lactamase superfamily)